MEKAAAIISRTSPTKSPIEPEPEKKKERKPFYTFEQYMDARRAQVIEMNKSTAQRPDWDTIDCPICNNRGYFYEVDDQIGIVVRNCECWPSRMSILNAMNSGMGRLTRYRLSDWQASEGWQKSAQKKVEDYIGKNWVNWFLACGQSGAGKTMLCSIIANDLLAKHHEVLYVRWSEFVQKLKGMLNRGEDYGRELKRLKEVPVLYLDDFFRTKPSDWERDVAFQIIDQRYTNELRTLISTENTMEELTRKDEAVAGRINEMAGGFCVNIPKDPHYNYRMNRRKDNHA